MTTQEALDVLTRQGTSLEWHGGYGWAENTAWDIRDCECLIDFALDDVFAMLDNEVVYPNTTIDEGLGKAAAYYAHVVAMLGEREANRLVAQIVERNNSFREVQS